MRMRTTLIIVAGLALACSKEVGASARGESPSASKVSPAGLGKKAEVTPELAEKARSILEAQSDAPLGTTVPFRLNGKDYIARFEEHENTEGDPNRPPGKHKGVTVYERSP
jgi:hypothetical protein